ncbi:hypothetical protein AGMMS50284_7370 [Clostridia bacterium]|nr:hypothetical protein AGMMS50284_7370 [Clostridia bacterium]
MEYLENNKNMIMFQDYPDVVDFKTFKKMLGNIGSNTAYRVLQSKEIPSRKIGREYRIPKANIITYLLK